MSKIARETGTAILPYIVEYASGVDFAKRLELRRGIEGEIDRHLAPTLALLDRLAAEIRDTQHYHFKIRLRCVCAAHQALTDYAAHKKERA